MQYIKSIRGKFIDYNDSLLRVKVSENELLTITCNEHQKKELDYLKNFLSGKTQLNLLNIKKREDKNEMEFLILEPDYLMDISSLAECFKPYGNHPLNYTLSRLKNKEITGPILLGNTANFFIDEFINEDANEAMEYYSLLRKLFQTSAFEFSVCKDLQEIKKEADFFRNCHKHYLNIRHVIEGLFVRAGIEKKKIILEPAFICNSLGLQGRMDILLSDYSALIELKSGKAVEDFRTGGQFIKSAINHYIQMILYSGILEFNLEKIPEEISCYLLYSKYPVLNKEQQDRKRLIEALGLRNRIIAYEYSIQESNNIYQTEKVIEQINSTCLNTEKLTGKLFENYLAPPIDSFQESYRQLNELEKTYFLRLYTFIVKELWLSKAGKKEYEGIEKASVLWNASFEDKLISGEILYDLIICENKSAEKEHSISLIIPYYKDIYLPNFREGDAIVLYERNSTKDHVNNRQVFKGTIEKLTPDTIKIRLRYRQKNPLVWHSDSCYAIEHDYMDTTYLSMFRALYSFIDANPDRKELLLCQRFPKKESECFLLVGPPGTGKTSVYLRSMVEEELKKEKSNILLLAYTNRAVDEICKALVSISEDINYIRIGNELTCASEYRHKLLECHFSECTNRKEVGFIIRNCRIFVGTVASIWNKPELLQLKVFDLCIVDEATQLLEPHLLGLFCAKAGQFTNDSSSPGLNSIKRFVLIGDPKQLPAITLQTKEESRVNENILNKAGFFDLSDSLFERLYKKYKNEKQFHLFGLLSQQGRMHPDLSVFPSVFFYDGLLKSIGLPHQNEIWTDEKRLYFHSVKPDKKEKSNKSNLSEANEIVRICMNIYEKRMDKHDSFSTKNIGIITPFRNQIALIRKQLLATGITDLSNIMVDTVERYQGSQKDIIIYSFCIKSFSQLEALPNWTEENNRMIDRKLNVVLTRARKQLFIIGDDELLSHNPLYNQLIQHIKERDGFIN